MQLSEKLKNFLIFLLHLWNLHLILEKKYEAHSVCILEIISREGPRYLNV